MYGNPYLNNQFNLNKIDNNIKELQALRQQMQNYQPMQQPSNIINVGNAPSFDFEAKFLSKDQVVEDLFVTRKTAFISPENGFLKIKDVDGTITVYELIAPKDEKDIKIEELERRLQEYEYRANNENNQPYANDIGANDTTAKNTSRAISKKS